MIGPPRKNGRPSLGRAEDAAKYGLTYRQIRRVGLGVWRKMPDLAKRVIANDLARQKENTERETTGVLHDTYDG